MISVVVYQWRGPDPKRQFLPEHVNALARRIRATASFAHRFVCVTDETEGFDPDVVDVVATPAAAKEIGRHRSPEGVRFPSCYPRLFNFHPDAADVLGARILALDIDLVVIRDLAPLVARTEPFVGWRPYRDWGRKLRIGGGIYLMTAGAFPDVWTDFTGEASIRKARAAGLRGSDQAWMSYKLAHRVPYYGRDAGIYSIRDLPPPEHKLPRDALLVQMNGPQKPWSSSLAWVKENGWQPQPFEMLPAGSAGSR